MYLVSQTSQTASTIVADQRRHSDLKVSDITAGVGRLVGNTPLVEITRVRDGIAPSVRVFGKAEFMNPGGSVKDRAALNMIRRAIQTGQLRSGMTLIDASSGNTGIAYAMICASIGVQMELAIPGNASPERLQLLRAYGAKLILTDPMEGMDGAQKKARSLAEADPSRYFYPDQYNNKANWEAHYFGTGPEIVKQTNGRVTHFVAGLGTTGTFTGTARHLQERLSNVQCISFQPDSPMHSIEGMKHLPTSMVPGIYDDTLADSEMTCGTEEALEMTSRLAREEGLLVGISSGASVAVALRVAQSLEEGTVVTVLCDSGSRYLSHSLWSAGQADGGE